MSTKQFKDFVLDADFHIGNIVVGLEELEDVKSVMGLFVKRIEGKEFSKNLYVEEYKQFKLLCNMLQYSYTRLEDTVSELSEYTTKTAEQLLLKESFESARGRIIKISRNPKKKRRLENIPSVSYNKK